MATLPINELDGMQSVPLYTGEDLKPHLREVLDFKSLLVSYLENESAMRI